MRFSTFVRYFAVAASLFVGLSVLGAQTEREVQRPVDRPVHAQADQVKRMEEAIAPYVKQAKATLPDAKKRYLAGLPKGEMLDVTVKLTDDDGRYEITFVRVAAWKEKRILGVIDTEIALITKYKLGQEIEVNEDDVLDWTIMKNDGSEEGNLVGKFLDTYRP